MKNNKKNIAVYYDDDNDVMSIYTGNEEEYYGEQEGDYVELRSAATNKPVGYIIFNYEKHLEDESILKMPWRKIDFVVEIAPVIAKYFEDNYE